MTVKTQSRSRLLYADLVIIDGVEFFDTLDLPTLLIQSDDLSYTVKAGDRIDLLAQQYYGDPVLWWVLALANDMELLPTALEVGATLRIPAQRYVNTVIAAKSRTVQPRGR